MYIPEFFEWWHLPIVFLAGLIGEGYGTLVGGGSIVIQSTLIFLGLPPHSAIAIDNAGAIASELGIISVAWKKAFKHKKLVILLTIALGIGGVIGTHVFIGLDPQIVKYLMAIMTAAMLIYTFFKEKRKQFIMSHKHYYIIFLVFIMIGFYNNIISIGEGTFARLALMLLLGMSFIEFHGLKTLGTIPIRIYSWIVTAIAGFIIYPYLITLMIANFIAGRYATKLAAKLPEKVIMQLLVTIAIFFIIYILLFHR